MFHRRLIAVAAAALCLSPLALAQEFFVYPQQGQSTDQQKQDEFECYGWAKDQSGFDPMALPTASRPPPAKEPEQGGVVGGAVGGAAAGALVGAITGDTKKWAGRGAATGALVGGVRRNDQRARENAAQQNWEQEQIAQYQAGRNNYNRAYAACLTGRGYTVN